MLQGAAAGGEGGGWVVGKGVCSLMPTGGDEGWRARVQSCALETVRLSVPGKSGILVPDPTDLKKVFWGCGRQTSLVVQWLKIHLAVQGMQVQSLAGVKIPHTTEQLSPCATSKESMCCNERPQVLQLRTTQPNK